MINLTDAPKSEHIVRIGRGFVQTCYDRKGLLRWIRKSEAGEKQATPPKPDETVFRVSDGINGESTFKSSASHCGYFSARGSVYWSTIWDDDGPSSIKECSFQDWVDECARVLAGEQDKIVRP